MSILPLRLPAKNKSQKKNSAQPQEGSEVPGAKNEPDSAGKVKKEKKKKKAFISKSLSSKRFYWRLVLAGFLSVVFMSGSFYAHSWLENLVGQIEQKRSQWVALSEREVSYKKMDLDLAQVEEEAGAVEQAFPGEKDVIDFFNQVRSIEEKTGVVVESKNFESDQPRVDEGNSPYLELTVQVRGQLESLESFFGQVFSLPILIRAETITFDDLNQPESVLQFRCRIYVSSDFYLE